MKKIFAIVALCCMALGVNAQSLNGSVGIETTHLWRGYEVSNGLTVDADLHLTAGGFNLGLWGGRQIDGQYKEFDYYASYSAGGFTVSLWDIFNYSYDGNKTKEWNDKWQDVFNYDKETTSHFLDLGVAYNFGAVSAFKLQASWNTIIYGRDLDNGKNQYSTYVKLAYPVAINEDLTLTPSIGGSFKLSGDGDFNFYSGKKSAINDICLSATYNVHVSSKYTIPVTGTAMWAVDQKRGHYCVSATILSF